MFGLTASIYWEISMPVSIDFQNRINDLIAELNYKKSQLPQIMNIDYRSLSNAINYGIIPKPRILIRLADFFNIPIKYLLGKSDNDYFFPAKNKSDFNSRFSELCKEKQITYYKVSQACHFDKSYISRWINKNYLPSLEMLELLSDYFNVSIDYLLGRSDDR